MKSVGIICEYNPFHNGHLYHIQKTKELYPNHVVILVLSGNFTQRGLTSIMNKWDKAKIALEYGVDLIIELPFPFATQSADIFAHGSISILKHLGVNSLVFGSESGDLKVIDEIVKTQLYNKDYDKFVKEEMNSGINYPSAMSNALIRILGYTLKTPNDLLAISYLKEIEKQKADIKVSTIKRTNDFHNEKLDSDVISASAARVAIKDKIDISKFVPKKVNNILKEKTYFTDDYYSLFYYQCIVNKDLSIYQTVDEGIEYRIKKHLPSMTSYEKFIDILKTRRYTYNKLNRMYTHILCGFTKEMANSMKEISYIRVLGMNNIGRDYLSKIKKDIDLPIITACNSIDNEMLNLEYRTTCIYSDLLNDKEKEKLILREFNKKPIIKEK